MKLVLQDVGTLGLAIYQLSVLIKKRSPFVEISMEVLTAILVSLGLFEMLVYLTSVDFIPKHELLVFWPFEGCENRLGLLHL